MKINGLEGLTPEQLYNEVQRGGRFVVYLYCISVLILTFKQPSDVYFIRPEESSVTKGLVFSLVTLFLGWWGFPWGPIYSVESLWTNFDGGKDVTREVMASLAPARAQRVA